MLIFWTFLLFSIKLALVIWMVLLIWLLWFWLAGRIVGLLLLHVFAAARSQVKFNLLSEV